MILTYYYITVFETKVYYDKHNQEIIKNDFLLKNQDGKLIFVGNLKIQKKQVFGVCFYNNSIKVGHKIYIFCNLDVLRL
jgi:hypothetical protein